MYTESQLIYQEPQVPVLRYLGECNAEYVSIWWRHQDSDQEISYKNYFSNHNFDTFS